MEQFFATAIAVSVVIALPFIIRGFKNTPPKFQSAVMYICLYLFVFAIASAIVKAMGF